MENYFFTKGYGKKDGGIDITCISLAFQGIWVGKEFMKNLENKWYGSTLGRIFCYDDIQSR